MSFKDGRIGVGKDPIFPLDISGSCRIDGDLILGGRFSDSQGNPIQLGSGSGATSTPDQTSSSLPSWQGGTITTQGLGVFKGVQDPVKESLYINGDSAYNMANTTGSYNTTVGYQAGVAITGGGGNVIVGRNAGRYINNGANNVMVGNFAGHAYNSTENVFIGKFSGYANSKSHNVSIGCDTMQQAYPTEYSVAIGYMAGYGAGGENQIYIGREAGKSTSAYNNQTGDNNIGIGAYALNKVTSGAENVAIGSGAGTVLTSGTRNTILGFEAAYKLTSSGSNVIIGARAGYNCTAAYNTFVGTFAGNKNTSGNENTSIGYSAGYNLTTGTGNTIMGYQAGYSHTTGHSNVLIGENCGYNHTTPSYNTFIGYGVGMNNNNTNGSNVFIGKSAAYYNNGCFNVALGKEALMGYMNQGATRNGDANVAIGYQAAWRHDGHGNVIIGPYSGNQSTTIVPSSIHDNVCVGIYTGTKLKNSKGNVFIGPYAGQNFSRTSSMDGYNTFVGYYAGKATTTGEENVAVGREAGTNITSGADNVCIGAHSGKQITTGRGNTCLGWDAGGDITTGFDNIAIGRYCCREGAVTGGYNIMMGYFTGHPLTSGASNVGIGNTCLRNITTGNYNTCVGISCGRELTTGNNNTFYGNAAGYKNTTGYQNIAIGYNANYYETTGGNNIAIGHHAGTASGSTGNEYKLYINTYAGYYGEDSFIYGHGKMTDNPFLNVNADLNAGYKNTGAHPSTITNGYNWQGVTANNDGTVTWKAGTGGTAGGMAPRGGWDANTTYVLTVTSKTTAGSYTLGGTTFNPGTSYATQVKEFTGSLGEMRNNWSSNNQITFKRWDVSIKNQKMLNVHRLGGVGINDDRVYEEDFGYLDINTSDFHTLRRGGKDYTSRSVLTVGGSMILSTISGGNDNSSSNIYFNAPNAQFQTGLIWRRENPGAITYMSGAILFDSRLSGYGGNTSGYSAGGLSFYTSVYSSGGWSSSTAKLRMVISGNGNVGIGYDTPSYKFAVAGSVYFTSGGLNGSDDRIKHNEQPIVNALSIISKLKPKHYIKTGKKLYDASHNFQLDIYGNPLDASGNPLEYMEDYTIETGIIAQEIKKIPELQFVVLGDETGDSPLGVDYNSIHCTHIAATQELDRKILDLYKENEMLKARLAKLEAFLGI